MCMKRKSNVSISTCKKTAWNTKNYKSKPDVDGLDTLIKLNQQRNPVTHVCDDSK